MNLYYLLWLLLFIGNKYKSCKKKFLLALFFLCQLHLHTLIGRSIGLQRFVNLPNFRNFIVKVEISLLNMEKYLTSTFASNYMNL